MFKTIPLKYSLQNLLVRKVTTFFTIIGLALVVFVFASVLMLDNGLKETVVSTGEKDNIVITRRGAISEIQSSITQEQALIVSQVPGIANIPEPQVSNETVVLINLQKKNGNPSNVAIRGLSKLGISLRRNIRLTEGRIFKKGSNEAIIGNAIVKRFRNMGLAQEIQFGGRSWRIVGHFDSGRNGFESEIWVDSENLMQAFRRTTYSTVIIRLVDQKNLVGVKNEIKGDIRLPLQAKKEKSFYADQSIALSKFIKILGLTLTIIFSIGAIIGAAITMQSAVINRVAEIATLRALGFKRKDILLAFLLEALLLSIFGGIFGLVLALGLTNLEFSTTNFQSFSELAFTFSINSEIVFFSMLFSIFMGCLGGLIPATFAAKINITKALRMT